MPISPENQKRYPENFPCIRMDILHRANNCCEGSPDFPDCRALNGSIHDDTGSRVVLTTAHLNHIPEDCDGMESGGPVLPLAESNLRAWCQRCHLHYDNEHHQESRLRAKHRDSRTADMFGLCVNQYIDSGAVISDCGFYRYELHRCWDLSKPICTFIGLNPSTADANKDDKTISRMVAFATLWGFGSIHVVNIFAYRTKSPKLMKAAAEPIGEDNNYWIQKNYASSSLTVACWGIHGVHMNRGDEVREMLPFLKCLVITANKQPGHPLYLKGDHYAMNYPGGDYAH